MDGNAPLLDIEAKASTLLAGQASGHYEKTRQEIRLNVLPFSTHCLQLILVLMAAANVLGDLADYPGRMVAAPSR